MDLCLKDLKQTKSFLRYNNFENTIERVCAIISETEKYINPDFKFNCLRSYDNCTYLHCRNVALLTIILAQELGYYGKSLKEIALGALLHDIGKLKVPKSILNKPSSLNDAEYNLIKKHPEEGMKILETSSLSNNICMPIMQHHERMDGTGYPLGLKAEEIHPNAQIVAVADVFDALISDRPYRRGLTLGQALEIIIAGKGKDFSREVVEAFLSLFVL